MNKQVVQLAQVNFQYGQNVFLPHSAGVLQAYAQAQPELAKAYEFRPPLFLREDPKQVASDLQDVSVLGLSCYVWNWQWCQQVARLAKAAYPDCQVVMGGPQIPDKCEGFFDEHPYVDVLVHGEGELAFADLLRARLDRDGQQRHYCVGHDSSRRIADLSKLVSPYLAGVYDPLLAAHPEFLWNASAENSRGCPYSCRFCDWGSATFTKLRQFPEERILAEMEWCGRHRIEFLCNCDANYGLLPRDLALTQAVVETKRAFGYPKRFKAAWAKNSNDRVFEMASMLHNAEMDKGVTLSLQSLNPETLKLVKRQNMETNDFQGLMTRYRQAGIPTYTELILGLPGETYESFREGLCRLLDAGCHEGINVYPCSLFVNAEMSDPGYIDQHGIRSVVCPILQNHSSPGADPVQELDRVVVGTNTMPPEDWKEAFLWSWAVQSFHSLGLLQHIARTLNDRGVMDYGAFYDSLLAHMERAAPDTSLGSLYQYASGTTEMGMAGLGWGHRDRRFGNLWWPIEEFSFLTVVAGGLPRFYAEVMAWLSQSLVLDPDISDLAQLVKEQWEMVVTPADAGSSVETFAREVVWYGRKGGKFLKRKEAVR